MYIYILKLYVEENIFPPIIIFGFVKKQVAIVVWTYMDPQFYLIDYVSVFVPVSFSLRAL